MADSTTTFPLTGPINLLARLGSGSLTVTAGDGVDVATVRLTPHDPRSDVVDRFTVELRGATLEVAAPSGLGVFRRGGDAVDAEILVPAGTAMKLNTGSAPITVAGRSGGADIAAGSGSVEVDTVDGDLRLRYGSSSGTVQAVTGSAAIKAGSGNTYLGEVGGSVEAAFGSGDLEVGTAHGSVRSRAGSGSARIGVVHADVDLAAGSGGLTIGLPSGVSARLEVTTGSGRVHSDLPIEISGTPDARSISVRARTGSGDVRVFRAA